MLSGIALSLTDAILGGPEAEQRKPAKRKPVKRRPAR